jgi:hypothetical protein
MTANGTPSVVSVAEHAGWAHLVCVSAVDQRPCVIVRQRVTLIDEGLPTQPYHHDSIGMREEEADALIARVRRSIETCAALALHRVKTEMAAVHPLVAMAIRLPPFPELPQSVAHVRKSYRLQCCADGMLYQLALCRTARDLDLGVDQYPRGDETLSAAEQLGVAADDLRTFVTQTGRPYGAPWTEDHRRAYAAGIATLARHVHAGLRIRT